MSVWTSRFVAWCFKIVAIAALINLLVPDGNIWERLGVSAAFWLLAGMIQWDARTDQREAVERGYQR